MLKIMAEIHHWFAERNIPTGGLTIIINLQDVAAGAHLDFELNKEFASMSFNPMQSAALDIRNFTMNGIRVKVESPVHEPDDLAITMFRRSSHHI